MVRVLSRLVLVLVGLAGGAAVGAAVWSPAGAAPPPDTAYTAVAPCVVFDSRAAQGATGGFVGPLNGNQAVTYDLTGTYPIGQGGGHTTCGIPDGADAVEINIVAVNALNEGNLRVSDGSPVTSGGVVNYNNLTPKLNTSSSVIIPLDATGHLVVTPNCGTTCSVDTTDVRGVVLGYFSDGLATRVAALEALLADVTRIPDAGVGAIGGKDTLRFSGMNVQIVDGTGDTGCNDSTPGGFETCNGQGNLAVGYAENFGGASRVGSHNLVGGTANGWTSFGGIVMGNGNRISNDLAVVLGGEGNDANGVFSSVVGGVSNNADGFRSVAVGGAQNSATENNSTVSGGEQNTASGFASSVSGGSQNTARGYASSVSGGQLNLASDDDCAGTPVASSVTGGQWNEASGCNATVTGGGFSAPGDGNSARGPWSTVTGGDGNGAFAPGSVVVGGYLNFTGGDLFNAVVVGGYDNAAHGRMATVVGGHFNDANGEFSVVGGGHNRTASGQNDWVAGSLFQDL